MRNRRFEKTTTGVVMDGQNIEEKNDSMNSATQQLALAIEFDEEMIANT